MSIIGTTIDRFDEPLLVLEFNELYNYKNALKLNIKSRIDNLPKGNAAKNAKKDIDVLQLDLTTVRRRLFEIVAQVSKRSIPISNPADIFRILTRVCSLRINHFPMYISALSKYNFPQLFTNTINTALPVVDSINSENPWAHSSCLLVDSSKKNLRIVWDQKNVFFYSYDPNEEINSFKILKFMKGSLQSSAADRKEAHYVEIDYHFDTAPSRSKAQQFKRLFEGISKTLEVYKNIPAWKQDVTSFLSKTLKITGSVCSIMTEYMIDPLSSPTAELCKQIDLAAVKRINGQN